MLIAASLQDRRDALVQLAATLAVGGLAALLLSTAVGWFAIGATLRPIERMRREASAIPGSAPEQRLGVAGDRDEVQRLGRTLNDLLDRLQDSVATKHRFLDTASHELRTPVTILRGELELALAPSRMAEELRSAVRSAHAEAEHLAVLAESLLVMSRSSEGRLELHREAVDLSDLVEQVALRFESRAEAQQVGLQASAVPGSADVDRTRVRQALDNLIDNALRHTPRGGEVTLALSRRGDTVVMVVEDSGPGFSPDLLPEALEPFSSGPNSPGAGLGLSIVRAIAEAHGGRVRVANRTSGGARVVITLGAAASSSAGTTDRRLTPSDEPPPPRAQVPRS